MTFGHTIRVFFSVGVVAGMAACTASVPSKDRDRDDDKDDPPQRPEDRELPPAEEGLGRLDADGLAQCQAAFAPGRATARRLTRREYNNTVADLLSDDSAPASTFPTDERRLNFDNNAEYLSVSPVLTESYQKAAERLAATAVNDKLDQLLPCEPEGDGRACAEAFIQRFGSRAYRRPLADEEKAGLLAVFDQGNKASFENGVKLVIEALLQSAPFLYRLELDEAEPDEDYVPVTSWQMASRLSYFLWATMPDEELLALAEADELTRREVVQEQVDRMLASPRAARMIGDFHEQWLGLGDLVAISKDSKLFPDWKSDTTAQLKRELREFTTRITLAGGGFQDLMTTDESFVNGDLARLYGFDGGPAGADFEPFTEAGGGRRAGVLTLGAVLANAAKPDGTSPVLRGVFVREQLLCQHLPPPPQDVDTTLPEVGPDVTTRERFAQHSTDPACSGCHKLIDPVGLGFEAFDAIGRHRDEEGGNRIDTSGELVDADVTGTFDGAVELGDMLSKSQEAQRCLVTNWFRFGFGRTDSDSDACFLHELDVRFKRAGGRVEDVIRGVTESDAFFFRSVEVSP